MKPAASASVAPSKPALIPTNTVTTKDGISVRARIDPSLAVVDVVRQLCSNLKVPDHPALYALRDDQDELVTDENLVKKIRDKAHLKLVSSPVLEAVDIVEKLTAREEKSMKLALFSLQKYIQEDQFANEFLKRRGLAELLEVIAVSHGNTLAYALKALQNLMALDYGWSDIPRSFASQLVQILENSQNLVNVSRPATSILKRLVEADPRFAPQSQPSLGPQPQPRPGTGNGPNSSPKKPTLQIITNPKLPRKGIWCYGFDFVWDAIRSSGSAAKPPTSPSDRPPVKVLETVVQKLSSGDAMMATDSMMLLNALLKNATDARWEELANELERLNVRKTVVRMTSSSTMMEELSSQVLEFQANLLSLAYRRKTTPVDPDIPSVQEALNTIWSAAKVPSASMPQRPTHRSNLRGGTWDGNALNDSQSENGQEKWVKIGFESENLRAEFARVGLLGLDCLRILATQFPDWFAEVILEQHSRSAERRCPIARASNEVVELLSEHYQIFAPGYSTSSSFRPYFLWFHRVHNYALQFFIRIWNESAAAVSDFARVAALVRSQIAVALRDETRPWHEVEHDFIESDYRAVRERQMRELELEDDLVNKPPVRNLRAKLYKESFEFVRSQRIQCLMLGAWFVNGNPMPASGTSPLRESVTLKRSPRPWRFFRLDKSMRYLHYIDSAVKIPIRSGLEDLPEKIEVAHIAEITPGTCALPPNIHTGGSTPSDLPPGMPGSPATASPLSFSLLSTRGESLADLVAENATCYADWIDGFNMLRGDHFSTKETADLVHILTEIGLKIKLLDLSGEKVDIPSHLPVPSLPTTADFFFSDYD